MKSFFSRFSVLHRYKKRTLSGVAVIGFILLITGAVYQEQTIERPTQMVITTAGRIDMCQFCHDQEKLDPAHDAAVLGCASCHLGDPLAITKDKAHAGMILNPGDLRIVHKTCGVNECHPGDVKKVHNSLMATNRGILGTLLYYWGESDSQDTELTVKDLIDSGENSQALDYFRKLCGTCHLWKQKNDLPGVPAFFNEKGGGCSACHYRMPAGHQRPGLFDDEWATATETEQVIHPLIDQKFDDQNCIRCHNRSGRIGLAYIGVFESEGYGTPYEEGALSSQQLPGERFYLELADDIHHRKHIACIDCHTREEVMGDGTSYAHYEEQLEISCEVCHSTNPGTTRKNNLMTNVIEEDGRWKLLSKRDPNIDFPINPPASGVCDFAGHKRVTCEACHSTWVPQCYGCHARRDASKTHIDKLSLEETPGRWEEGRSYIRYLKPMLAIWGDEVVVVTPGCQDMVTFVDEEGSVTDSFNRFTMAAINPHTTQEKGRTCVDCHASTKTVGLGEGTLRVEKGAVQFTPQHRGEPTASGHTPGLDTFVTLDGTPLQYGSRENLRPFNGDELRRILRVGLCVGCHDSYTDPAWKTYTEESVCPDPRGASEFTTARWPTPVPRQGEEKL
jgi:hypothetical protein